MEPPRDFSSNKNLWDDLRDTVRGGMREFRNMGDELARQGRLRMDIFQTERRLRSAFEALGEATYTRLNQKLDVDTQDPTLTELTGRINYYSDELTRLRNAQKQTPEQTA
jgi:uncharacterized protein YhdP